MKEILIVEDEFSYAKMMKLRLESEGYQVKIAGDAYSGTQMALRGDPDLIILDLGMPAGGGFTLLERVRNIPHKSMIPVIILTGKIIDTEITNKAKALNVSAIYSKPYNAVDFIKEVKTLTNS